jgi:GntR family transcriptional regulator, rspAB operon transcriptional repressor
MFEKRKLEILMCENLKDKAYRIIKNKIISCEYKPNEFLSELALMKEIEVGRTPIREALNKLEQEHLVRIIPKKGTLVSAIAYSDIIKVFEVRELMEPYIVKTYSSKIDKEILFHLKEEFEKAKVDNTISKAEMYEQDDVLHKLIFESSENNYFIYAFNSISNLNQRVRIMSGEVNGVRRVETYDEHIRIINLILENNWEKAALEMECHLKKSKESGLRLFLNM